LAQLSFAGAAHWQLAVQPWMQAPSGAVPSHASPGSTVLFPQTAGAQLMAKVPATVAAVVPAEL
jgi:hypothetical protein